MFCLRGKNATHHIFTDHPLSFFIGDTNNIIGAYNYRLSSNRSNYHLGGCFNFIVVDATGNFFNTRYDHWDTELSPGCQQVRLLYVTMTTTNAAVAVDRHYQAVHACFSSLGIRVADTIRHSYSTCKPFIRQNRGLNMLLQV